MDDDVVERAKKLANTDDPTIPNGIAEMLDSKNEEEVTYETDKTATPAERLKSTQAVEMHMERARSLIFPNQGDSDAQ